jgi:hypothetical protein
MMCMIWHDVRQMLNYTDIGDIGFRPAKLRSATVRPAYWLEDQDSFPDFPLLCGVCGPHNPLSCGHLELSPRRENSQGVKLTDHTHHLVSSVKLRRFAPSSLLLHGVAFDYADKFTYRMQRVNTVLEPVTFATIAFFWNLRLCKRYLKSYTAISFPIKAYSLSWQRKISCVLFQSFLNVGRQWHSSWKPVWTTSRQLSASVCTHPSKPNRIYFVYKFSANKFSCLKDREWRWFVINDGYIDITCRQVMTVFLYHECVCVIDQRAPWNISPQYFLQVMT